jgi:hypothetical protein
MVLSITKPLWSSSQLHLHEENKQKRNTEYFLSPSDKDRAGF